MVSVESTAVNSMYAVEIQHERGIYVPVHLCVCTEVFQGICCVFFLFLTSWQGELKGSLEQKGD